MLTLVVSDIHLGSRSSQAAALSRLLESEYDRLILNGDTINNLNLRKLRPKHWALVHQLREIARQRELILIRGNHDGVPGHAEAFGPLDVLATILGVQLQNEYTLDVGGRPYLVLHGDVFDPTLGWPILTDAADWCYRTVQEVNKKAAKWLKRRVKRMGGVVEFVKRRAVQHARKRGCHGVITGHTHFCDEEWVEGIHYLNTGCWVDHVCNYVVITGERAMLRYWDESAPVPPPARPLPVPSEPFAVHAHPNLEWSQAGQLAN